MNIHLQHCYNPVTRQTIGIGISGNKISSVVNDNTPADESLLNIDLDNSIVLPGFINAHDHLDFNCFQPLGDKTFRNYRDWGLHIHSNYSKEISAVLAIPKQLRIQWGIYKNLLNGFTTVMPHGEYVAIEDPPVTIYEDLQNLHSVGFEKNWRLKLNNPLRRQLPVAIHVSEGTDEVAAKEAQSLVKWNLWQRSLLGIHAVGMDARVAAKFKAIIWCPAANRCVLGADAPIEKFSGKTNILFGTDATLTGPWNAWEHFRMALSTGKATTLQLTAMLTNHAANTLGLNTGELVPGKKADILVIKNKNGKANEWFNHNPEDVCLVIQQGNIRLFDASLLPQINRYNTNLALYTPVRIGNVIKYVEGNLPLLISNIQQYYKQLPLPFSAVQEKMAVA